MFRFALFPTGDIGLENLQVAIINALCARQREDKFIIRVETLEGNKDMAEKDAQILDILKICGITYDALYYQHDNFKYHLQFASKLLDEKKAFICFCTPEEIKKKQQLATEASKTYQYDGTCEHLSSETILNSTQPFVIRLKKPLHDIRVQESSNGVFSFEKERIDRFVIMTEEKYPTYDFACAIDDMIQGVSHIIQESAHRLDAPKHEHIRQTLGYRVPITYTHLPRICHHDGEAMNQHDPINSVRWLLDHGYLPEAIVNYLIVLCYDTPQEIFTLKEAATWFDIDKISQTDAIFDIKTLESINQAHIANKKS
ncbi:glutamate--tRNA ligase family protein [Sulfurospirillum sp. 1612]|uniref:glutamate--tRNA ligase family protein n=1 Tax=Sulfurospirillum sp. 1612 TaxID=3094835 RepID=UPI002F937501